MNPFQTIPATENRTEHQTSVPTNRVTVEFSTLVRWLLMISSSAVAFTLIRMGEPAYVQIPVLGVTVVIMLEYWYSRGPADRAPALDVIQDDHCIFNRYDVRLAPTAGGVGFNFRQVLVALGIPGSPLQVQSRVNLRYGEDVFDIASSDYVVLAGIAKLAMFAEDRKNATQYFVFASRVVEHHAMKRTDDPLVKERQHSYTPRRRSRDREDPTEKQLEVDILVP